MTQPRYVILVEWEGKSNVAIYDFGSSYPSSIRYSHSYEKTLEMCGRFQKGLTDVKYSPFKLTRVACRKLRTFNQNFSRAELGI